MPSYRYQVRTSAGETQVGVINADNVTSAAQNLRNQGFRVLSVAPIAADAVAVGLAARIKELNAGKPKTKHVLDFTTQLAVMIRAGINLRAIVTGKQIGRAHV